MKTGLTTIMLAHNLIKIKYPFLSAIKSVIPVSDEVLVVDCDCTDGTIEAINLQNEPKVRILPGKWSTDDYHVQSEMINMAIKEVKTPWFFQIDADEVLYETSYPELIWLTKQDWSIQAARPHYIHLVGDFRTSFPFIYENRIRLAKSGEGWWAVGDACDIDKPRQPNVYMTKTVNILHTGKVHTGRRKEALQKEYTFQQLYKTLGFPDPKVVESLESGELDYDFVFASTKAEGKFTPFDGPYPEAIKGYIAYMESADSVERAFLQNSAK